VVALARPHHQLKQQQIEVALQGSQREQQRG